MLEVQGVATDRKDVFPYSGLRVLGFMQLTNGILVFILGVLDLAITLISYDDDIQAYGSRYEDVVTMTVASTPLWSGMWFALTGSLGTCFTRARAHTLQFFKLTFLVLNILCAALFGPVCAVVCGLIAIQRHTLDPDKFHWLLLLLLCFLAVLEVFISAATSSVTCCCSPLRGTQVHILINPGSTVNDTTPEKTTSERTTHARDDSFQDQHSAVSQATHVTKNPHPRMEIEVAKDEDNHVRELKPHQLGQQHNQMEPEHEPSEEHKYDGFGDSHSHAGSYTRLKKWALPTW